MRHLTVLFRVGFIGLCAAALVWQTKAMVSDEIHRPGALEGFVAGGTSLAYYGRHPVLRYRICAGLLGLFAAYCLVLQYKSLADFWPVLVPFACWVAYYGFHWPDGRAGLRSGLLAKPITVAAAWAWVTVFLAFPQAKWALLTPVFLERSAFIFALALAYDAVDIAYDRDKGFPTLAGRLEMQGALQWIFAGLVLSGACAGWAVLKDVYRFQALLPVWISLAASSFWLYFLLHRTGPYRWQKVLIDALMLFQCALVLLLRPE